MRYTKYDKLIDESYPEERRAVYEKLKKQLGLPDALDAPAESRSKAPAESRSATPEKAISKWRTSFKIFLKKPARLIACISTAVAVACLAIILPFTLNQGNVPSVTPTPTRRERYCYAASCQQIELKYSLKEYSELNKRSLLYIDWYDVADIKTSVHVANDDLTDIVYYEEILKHRGTGSLAELYITDLQTCVDKVEAYKNECKYVYVIRPSIKVFLGSDTVENGEHEIYEAYFTYGRYEYVIVLRYPMDKNSIFELVNSVLKINKR